MKKITVAAAVILNKEHELLVVRKQNTQYFMQVGGKLEIDEPPEQTIIREIQEEIGCEAQVEQFIGRFETQTANEPDHELISYLYVVAIAQSPRIAAEIAEMKWVRLDDQTTLLAPLTREIVIPWCEQQLLEKNLGCFCGCNTRSKNMLAAQLGQGLSQGRK